MFLYMFALITKPTNTIIVIRLLLSLSQFIIRRIYLHNTHDIPGQKMTYLKAFICGPLFRGEKVG